MTHWLDFLEQQLPRCKTTEQLDALSNVVQSAGFQGFLSAAEVDEFRDARDRRLRELKGDQDGHGHG